jgi:hypothetical protein
MLRAAVAKDVTLWRVDPEGADPGRRGISVWVDRRRWCRPGLVAMGRGRSDGTPTRYVRKFPKQLDFCLPNPPRIRLPLPGFASRVMNSRRLTSLPEVRRGIVAGQTSSPEGVDCRCPLWVNSGPQTMSASRPLNPQQQRRSGHSGRSEKCQEATYAVQ